MRKKRPRPRGAADVPVCWTATNSPNKAIILRFTDLSNRVLHQFTLQRAERGYNDHPGCFTVSAEPNWESLPKSFNQSLAGLL
jgi:hypothetical protein